jgi:NADP-dependent 3-hydroxy acid dehydrogenase YdfG
VGRLNPLVVITGASSGIGLALASGFAKEGNALLLLARHIERLPRFPQDRVAYIQADVADYAQSAIARPRPSLSPIPRQNMPCHSSASRCARPKAAMASA